MQDINSVIENINFNFDSLINGLLFTHYTKLITDAANSFIDGEHFYANSDENSIEFKIDYDINDELFEKVKELDSGFYRFINDKKCDVKFVFKLEVADRYWTFKNLSSVCDKNYIKDFLYASKLLCSNPNLTAILYYADYLLFGKPSGGSFFNNFELFNGYSFHALSINKMLLTPVYNYILQKPYLLDMINANLINELTFKSDRTLFSKNVKRSSFVTHSTNPVVMIVKLLSATKVPTMNNLIAHGLQTGVLDSIEE